MGRSTLEESRARNVGKESKINDFMGNSDRVKRNTSGSKVGDTSSINIGTVLEEMRKLKTIFKDNQLELKREIDNKIREGIQKIEEEWKEEKEEIFGVVQDLEAKVEKIEGVVSKINNWEERVSSNGK